MCENVFEFDGGLTCTCQEFDLGCGVPKPLTKLYISSTLNIDLSFVKDFNVVDRKMAIYES